MTGRADPRSYDDPHEVARAIAHLARPTLVVFDCDGVLAPLTDHADDSLLGIGVGDDLRRLASRPNMDVAILSGRSLDGLEQFDFDPTLTVWGSYGAERRGSASPELTPREAERLATLDTLLCEAAERAGDGAWVERKPTSVVLHVRKADPARGREAIEWTRARHAKFDEPVSHEGSNVIELMTRPADKGSALDELRATVGPASTVYLGDDVPDEDAFARLGDGDLTVKVGDADSIARRRLGDPDAVRVMLAELVDLTALA